VPDSSPWITYQGAWKDSGLSTSHYADNSIHFTNSRDAKAFITFNGTGVQIFGSKTDDHGRYSVSLDGATAASFDGKGVGESFQTSLYSARNLPIGQHTVTITNLEEGRYLDIDYVSMDIGDGNAQWVFFSTSLPSNTCSSSSNFPLVFVPGRPRTKLRWMIRMTTSPTVTLKRIPLDQQTVIGT
jgi:hypothetical protein